MKLGGASRLRTPRDSWCRGAPIGPPLSPCRRMCTVCSDVNFLVRIARLLPWLGTGSRLFMRVAVAKAFHTGNDAEQLLYALH